MKNVTGGRRGMALTVSLSMAVLGISGLLITLYLVNCRYAIPLDFEEYVSISRDDQKRPVAILDVDAILSDYGLPDPTEPDVVLSRYPDVAALCSIGLTVSYADTEGYLHIVLSADTKALLRGGLRVTKLAWDQQLPALSPSESRDPEDTGLAVNEDTESLLMTEGRLISLTDNKNNGLNLRTVCERVQQERDTAAAERFGEGYSSKKLSITFYIDNKSGYHFNTYRVIYRISQKTENVLVAAESAYLVIDIRNLFWTEGTGVSYLGAETAWFDTEDEAADTGDYPASVYDEIRLHGGGVLVEDKEAFDQNGFVRFFDEPTSFCMPNGIYWSPTYDLLTEDMVWRLTAVEGHSLVNLLRYCRKEIYARYYCSFDIKTESEFVQHYGSYPWYTVIDENLESRMTDAEKENIRLLREIQSLLES